MNSHTLIDNHHSKESRTALLILAIEEVLSGTNPGTLTIIPCNRNLEITEPSRLPDRAPCAHCLHVTWTLLLQGLNNCWASPISTVRNYYGVKYYSHRNNNDDYVVKISDSKDIFLKIMINVATIGLIVVLHTSH